MGIVTKDRSIFSALPFEEALDLIKKEKEQTEAMIEHKNELLVN